MAEHFRAFADVVERDGGTTYAAICRGVADNPDVLSLLDAAPPAQQRPLLLLAAVHFLLLSGDDHPLARFYDTVAAVRDGPESAVSHAPGDVATVFTDFCAERRAELKELIATRTTQTNEIGRCNALLPGLCHVAELHGREAELSLLDLGTSAGLNLLFDDYSFTLPARPRATRPATPAGRRRGSGSAARSAVSSTACPTWSCPAWATASASTSPPSTCAQTTRPGGSWPASGPTTPSGSAACAPPSRTRAAARRPPRLERGDMVADMAEVAATMSGDGPLVVFHSWVAAYLDEERQRALAAQVRALDEAGGRPVHHLYLEAAYETPGLPTPPPPESRRRGDLATALVLVPAGGGEPVRLADAHPHGRWLRWWPATRPGPRERSRRSGT